MSTGRDHGSWTWSSFWTTRVHGPGHVPLFDTRVHGSHFERRGHGPWTRVECTELYCSFLSCFISPRWAWVTSSPYPTEPFVPTRGRPCTTQPTADTAKFNPTQAMDGPDPCASLLHRLTQWRKSGSKSRGTPGQGPKGRTSGRSLEARRADRGRSSWEGCACPHHRGAVGEL